MLYKNIVTHEELAALLGEEAQVLLNDGLAPVPSSAQQPHPSKEMVELQDEVQRLQRTVTMLLERVVVLEQQLASKEVHLEERAQTAAQPEQAAGAPEAPATRMERYGRKKSPSGKWFS